MLLPNNHRLSGQGATLLFFGSWLRPLTNLDGDTCDAIYTHLTIGHIKNKVLNQSDLYSLYKQYKDKDLPSEVYDILDGIFTLPEKSIIKSGFACKDKEVNLTITRPFNNTAPVHDKQCSALEPGYTIYRLTQDVSSYRVNDVLEKYARNELSKSFWPKFHERLCDYLNKFEHRINILERMLERTDIPTIKLTKNSYPLIMICEDDNVMTDVRHEYRANRPLKLGTDITTIATNTEKNKQRLVQYLETNRLACKAILFSDLNC